MKQSALVFTDLDGSLLGHDHYEIDGALPGIKAFQARSIPIIPNTSKTEAEVLPLMQQQRFTNACIVENGSAIVLPAHSRWNSSEQTKRIIIGEPIAAIQNKFEKIDRSLIKQVEAFSAMSIKRIIALTNLSHAQAELAKNRMYSETLKWHGSDSDLCQFETAINQLGLRALRGGRFLHVIGNTNKGLAVAELLKVVAIRNPVVIGIGDSANDESLIEASHFGCWIKAGSGYQPSGSARLETYFSTSAAPHGWTESAIAALNWLENSDFKNTNFGPR